MFKKSVVLFLLALFILAFLPNITEAATYWNGRNIAFVVLYPHQGSYYPFAMGMTMDIGYEYSQQGNNWNVTRHYNSGLRHNYQSYPFSWQVYPVWFRWYINHSLVHTFTTFEWYPRLFPVQHAPWGGRHTRSIWINPFSDTIGGRTRATYACINTLPSTINFNHSFGSP